MISQSSVDSDKLFLATQAKYLGLWVRNDLSWDDYVEKCIIICICFVV